MSLRLICVSVHIFALMMLGAGLSICFLSIAVSQPLAYLAIHVATNSQVGEVTLNELFQATGSFAVEHCLQACVNSQ